VGVALDGVSPVMVAARTARLCGTYSYGICGAAFQGLIIARSMLFAHGTHAFGAYPPLTFLPALESPFSPLVQARTTPQGQSASDCAALFAACKATL
jgi:hypothetical protein